MMSGFNTYGGFFFSHDERQITTLGTGYIANFLAGGGATQAGATLTNKRIYFSGNVFSFNDKGHLSSVKQRKVVCVRDVTGVGYIKYSPIQYLIWGFMALIAGIVLIAATLEERRISSGWQTRTVYEPSVLGGISLAIGIVSFILLLILFLIYRKTLLTIEYAGGNIAFNVRWLNQQEQDVFIRNIHLAKDKLYSTAAGDQGYRSPPSYYNNNYPSPDEIPDL